MKILIASDLHGSSYYCQKMMNIIAKENPNDILLLGDILYHGPRNDLPKGYAPKEVIEQLNSIKNKITCVQGNCDAEVDQMVLQFEIKPGFAVFFKNNVSFFLTHGHHLDKDNLPIDAKKSNAIISGHTHVPTWDNNNSIYFLNPGSLSIPKENSPHSLMIYEDGEFKWIDIESDCVYHTLKI